FPRVGPIAVSGLTLAQAEEKIRNRASQVISGLKGSAYGPQNTFLRVTIEQVRTIRISLIGEVARPGEYNVSSLTTAYNALYLSGGPTEIGSFRNIQVKRKNRLIRTIDLYDYLLNADKKDDINLQDDDVLFVPAYETRVDLNGEIKKPGLYEVKPGETLGKVLGFAGGFSEVAYRSIIRLIRLTDRDRRLVDIKGEEVNGYVLQNADVINVERILDRYNNVVFVEGAVFRPGQYPLEENPTLKKLLDRAEGITPDAFTGRVMLLRRKADLTIEQLTFDLAKVLRGEAADIPLQKEDQVQILSVAQLREGQQVRIQGEVLNPYIDSNSGYFPWYEGMTIEDLLVSAGGLRQGASAYNIEVVRPARNNNTQTVDSTVAQTFIVSVNRDLSKNDSSSRFTLQPFDQVFVRAAPNYQAPQFVQVDGQVVNPGPYGIKSRDERISDLVARAGGLNQFAYVPGATLFRRVKLSQAEIEQRQRSINEISDDSQRAAVQADAISANQETQVGIDLRQILDNPHSEEDLILEEGDVLRIPKQQQTVRISGEVFYPTTTRFSPGVGFLEYISRGGGFTSRSIKRRSYVLYANGNVQRTKRFLFFNTYPHVDPGAEVIVPLKTKADISTAQVVSTLTQTLGALTTVSTILLVIQSLRRP
ncbi:MAG: SLBB domain-containing protein, partial [Cytophagaceae bacterium]|nr:SLBB domain-containing protein [Cytophagaceae bacterium]